MSIAPSTPYHLKPSTYHWFQGWTLCHFFSTLLGLLLYITIATTAHAAILTTLPPLAGLASMLDEKADIHCLLPPGADAHDFQLTPKQVSQLKQADLLIRASRDDGHWPGLALATRQLDLWPKKDHAWLLPSDVRQILPRLARTLEEITPAHRPAIEQALKRALRICDVMEIAWKQALMPLHLRGVIMQHPAWRRLCEHFNVPVLAILEPRHHGSIRPRKLESAFTLLQTHSDILLWGDMRHSNQGLIWLSDHHNSQTMLVFDALGTCGMAWTKLMHDNLKRIPK